LKDRIALQTIIFDLDGTLIHSSPDIAAALNAALAPFGHELPVVEVEAMIGGGLPALLRRALASCGLTVSEAEQADALERLRAAYREAPAARSRVHEWVVQVMAERHAGGARIAVCSNKDEALVTAILDALGLSRWIHGVAGYREGEAIKPAPDSLLRAITSAGGSVEGAVMVGDSAADVGVARSIGIPVILVPHGYAHSPLATLGADRIARDAAELRAALGAIG
jgi:phosphoglycolate phosphatase